MIPMQDMDSNQKAAIPGLLGGAMASVDRWMESHPWNPRLTPYLVYLGCLVGVQAASTTLDGVLYPWVYACQGALTLFFLIRYRRLVPELTLRFHWLAIPVGLGVAALWVAVGQAMVHSDRLLEEGPWAFFMALGHWTIDPTQGTTFYSSQNNRHYFVQMSPMVLYPSLVLRLIGMSLIVPMTEELFMRSLLLRSLHRPRQTALGLMQIATDLPVVGEWLIHTRWGREAALDGSIFGRQFRITPLGALTVFSVIATSGLWMFAHLPRDWPATFLCGVIYCGVLWATAKRGLGPVIWTHGITNAALWFYTLHTGDWQFL